eukprot:CCRYP_013920-RA/>CCRYP_013920-RA protein AED:0.04 eAED:0.04 QI:250/1/1/1/1/1/2/697/212
MPYDTGCSEMEAKLNLSLISPIPLRPTITRGTANNKHFATMAESPRGQTSSAGLVSPPSQLGQSLRLNMQNDKMLISSMQRSEMSREIYHIIRYNLPTSISKTTTLPQLILVSRAIEKKLYQGASSYRNYIDESTLKLRITALACAVLIHSEEGASRGERSDTCLRLLAQHGLHYLIVSWCWSRMRRDSWINDLRMLPVAILWKVDTFHSNS